MGSSQIIPIPVRVDIGILVIKRYSTFSKSPKLESSQQMQLSFIHGTLAGGALIYIYIFTNLISTSIHGTRKKEKTRQEQEISVSRIIARGKKKKYYRSKRKKRPTSSDPLKRIKRYAVSWSKEK